MLINKSTGKKIIEKTIVKKNFFGKALGLMFKKKANYALIFEFGEERRIALTMWFVTYPIDVLWLDSHKRVVEIKKDFMPWTNYTPKNKAKYVVELPEGYGLKFKIKDFVEWK